MFVSHDLVHKPSYSTLGSSTYPWDDVFTANGTVSLSDTLIKTNIKLLEYGLNEVLQLSTISYEWKNQIAGDNVIPHDLRQRKMGFNAQNLQQIIPEVVKTHDWYMESEESGQYELRKNKNLGVYYSDLIPVLTKAIQEQQEIINSLKEDNVEMRKELEELKNLIKAKD